MQVPGQIFKAYDIRGNSQTALTVDLARWIGRAYGVQAVAAGEREIAVGRDGRLSGPELSAALIEGLRDAGLNVLDVGMGTTPMLYFAAATVTQSGIQVTGSHNPKDDNGFKMVLAGKPFYGAQIQAMRQWIEAQIASGTYAPAAQRGDVRHLNLLPAYRDRIVGDVKLARPMKIVVDSGNGVAGASAPGIFKAMGCDVIELYSEVDGNFPNHHPDPSKPENLTDVQRVLRETDAEIGFAFDGDGDRLGIVTKDGQVIYPDRQMILFVRDVLKRHPGGAIVYDVKCSQRLAPEIRAAGGVAEMSPTGHSLIKVRMAELNAPFGGEMSGHIFFRDRWYGFDDGTYSGARMLELLSRAADPSALLNSLPQSHNTPELNVHCAEGESFEIVKKLKVLAADGRFAAPAEVNTIDGVRVDWPDGFGLIRASNTTPILVLRFEGHTEAALKRIEATMMAMLREVKPDAQLAAAAH